MAKIGLNFLWVLCLFILVAGIRATTPPSAGFYSLSKGKFHVNVTNWGATLVSLSLPDAKGNVSDITLGFDSLTPYMEASPSRPYFGATVGRVANRIKDAKFTLNNVTYNLAKNDGNNTLHGGVTGFDRVAWEVKEYKPNSKKPYIKFAYHSKDGEEGFPGDLDVTTRYTITKDMELRIDMEAEPRNKATPVSLINHAYWNLAGHNSGNDILDHSLRIWASKYTPTDSHLIPTGKISSVDGTPLDFRKERTIGSRINKLKSNEHPKGYDHNYVLDSPKKKNGLRAAARVMHHGSKRVMEVWTSAPAVQFYTSNNMQPTKGKAGMVYKPHSAFCLETQMFPNAVNQPNFPSVIVNPGKTYKHTSLFKFSVDK
eukprot:TRINITY_DN31267_c0_g1_i1.p1 TRINITY_DN31267_c0_g1~~TRINITY_DN31267_c0_g1_i1.p1  ORF type:complete len:371 (+),score=57.14 TRINITY_DN31267_c0_g1_i1:467-1579(+)